jgi:uncharacterized membrane protein YidH (DUF202 family)
MGTSQTTTSMTREPLNALGLMASPVMIVFPLVIGAEAIRLAAAGLDIEDSVLPDVGKQLLAASGWVMPLIGASILTAYVGLIPISRADMEANGHAARAVRVLPWVSMAAAVAAVLWSLFGALALFRDLSTAGTLAGTALGAALAVAFASLAGSMLRVDPERALRERFKERAEIRVEIERLRPVVRLGGSGAVAVLVGWAVIAFAVPAGVYTAIVGLASLTTDESRAPLVLLATTALLSQFVPWGASLFQGPHVVRWLERTFGGLLFALGTGGYVAMAIVFATFAERASAGSRYSGLAFSASFVAVAFALALLSMPGISGRVPWLRRWTPDAAILALALRRLRRSETRIQAEIDRIEAHLQVESPKRSTRTLPRWLRRRTSAT